MNDQRLWVFGYGSLMWNPGFAYDESMIAKLPDFQRSFCMRSIHHRGTTEKPGLVLALDQKSGAECKGLALRVRKGDEEATVSYLRERELISSAYLETQLPVELSDGCIVQALTFVVDTNHVQYCDGIPLAQQAKIISAAVGDRGRNAEYLHNTMAHLQTLGLFDDDLSWLDSKVRSLSKE